MKTPDSAGRARSTLMWRKCRSALAMAIMLTIALLPHTASGATLGVGLSFSEQFLDADKGQLEAGSMEGPLILLPALSLDTDIRYFKGNPGVGGYVSSSIGLFAMDKQDVNGTTQDLGTSVRGFHLYVTPMLAYSFGTVMNAEIILGLGFGVGYLYVDGDMRMTNEAGTPTVDFSGGSFGLSAGVLIQASTPHWSMRITNYAPMGRQSGYDLMQHNVSMVILRTFSLSP